jgi:hypothetical protein
MPDITFNNNKQWPDPGWYRDIPEADYHALDACSRSRLVKLAMTTPFGMRYAADNPEPPTDAMILGSATDVAILEPPLFARQYSVARQCEATTKAGLQCSKNGSVCLDGVWHCGTHAKGKGESTDPRTVLSAKNFQLCIDMKNALPRRADANALIHGKGCLHQVTLLIEAYGLFWKMRLDVLNVNHRYIADLKTTVKTLHPTVFERVVFNMGYDIQGAVYTKLARKAGLDIQDYWVIPIEKTPPHSTREFRIEDDKLEEAWVWLQPHIEMYRMCLDTGVWPEYPEGPVDIGIPAYKTRTIVDDDE